MSAYYNEFDPKAAAWLRQLIKNGDIAPGEVDERSITDVTASDLGGFTQHHFFAGIGVWSYALRNSGWPDSRPVCTASLPCQPFSAAGKQKGTSDERHLLPHFLDLVRECGFNTIIGEQVESAIRHGWLDDLQTTMEAQGYAVGHCVLGAHSAGSFHQRQRLYWVAHAYGGRLSGQGEVARSSNPAADKDWQKHRVINDSSCCLGNTQHDGQLASTFTGSNAETVCNSKTRANSTSESKGAGSPRIISSEFSGMGYSSSFRRQQQQKELLRDGSGMEQAEWEQVIIAETSCDSPDIEWLYCRDNKYRAVKSGIAPLVNGTAEGVGFSGDTSQPIDADYSSEARAMRLKGYGNAIQAGTAQMFIEAFMEAL